VNEKHQATLLLERWQAGDPKALDDLMPLVYSELRRIAQSYLRTERVGHTLQATALVNEAYLRLIDQGSARIESRSHFMSVAATMMRRILVDYARKRLAHKRGWECRVTLDEEKAGSYEKGEELLALDEALEKLAEMDPSQARLVELKYFGGLTIEETAAVIGISPATAKRQWNLARGWLRVELGRD
jgi:RNA polymerase sigma factor (TIGR02999 family)